MLPMISTVIGKRLGGADFAFSFLIPLRMSLSLGVSSFDLLKRSKLPIFDVLKEGLEKTNRDRMHRLAFKKTERAKKKRRIELLQSRDKQQKAHSKWAKEQKSMSKRDITMHNRHTVEDLKLLVKEALYIQITPSEECFNWDGGLEVPGCWTAVMSR